MKLASYIIAVCVFVNFLISGCTTALKINGKKHLYLSEEASEIKLTADYDMRFHYRIRVKCNVDEIKVNPKGLKLTYLPEINDAIRDKVHFNYKKGSVNEELLLKKGETFGCILSPFYDSIMVQPITEIHILPSNFITHNGVSLIMDTIKIKVR